MKRLLPSLCACLLLGLPAIGRADGLVFRPRNATSSVQATEQRAILWLRDGIWELHIQPRFQRDPGAAAWVVPFPVRPHVHTSHASFFDELELLTAPVFAQLSTEPHCGDGNGNESDANRLVANAPPVRIWDQGLVGALDYVVLSAVDGESLAGWLDANGYTVPAEAEPLLSSYNADGAYFFAARLSAEADPDRPLVPVRFALPGLEAPFYPLRMTALGVPPGETFDLTIWVIAPGDRAVTPVSHSVIGFQGNPSDGDAYARTLDQALASLGGEGLVRLYTGYPGETIRFGTRPVVYFRSVYTADAGLDPPATWSPEVQELEERSRDATPWESQPRLWRFEARLPASAMADDLVFAMREAEETEPQYNVYVQDTGPCWSCDTGQLDGCNTGRAPVPSPWLWVVLCGWIGWTWRRRRAAARGADRTVPQTMASRDTRLSSRDTTTTG